MKRSQDVRDVANVHRVFHFVWFNGGKREYHLHSSDALKFANEMNINKRGLGGGGLVVDENIDLWRGSPYWANIPGEANFLLVFLMDHGPVCLLGLRTLCNLGTDSSNRRVFPLEYEPHLLLFFFSPSCTPGCQ